MSSLGRKAGDLLECFLQAFPDTLRNRAMVTVRPSDRFVDDLVDQPSDFSRCAVMPIVSAASPARSALFHRIEAQPSGEITE
jgi:hypothetical protein